LIKNLALPDNNLLMAWFRRSSLLTFLTIILAVALMLGLIVNIPAQVQARSSPNSLSSKLENAFPAPLNAEATVPTNTQGGQSRCPCVLDTEPTALVPVFGMGETIAEYPTFFWSISGTSFLEVEFALWDEKDKEVYKVRYALAESAVKNSSIISLTLPAFANLSPLKIGEKYRWVLASICDHFDRSLDHYTEGWIKRVEADPTLARRIEQATPEERVGLYADARLWYDTVATLSELRRDRPNDKNLAEAWDTILKLVRRRG
jgi:hypothetical protein